jgi:hypothetical protein
MRFHFVLTATAIAAAGVVLARPAPAEPLGIEIAAKGGFMTNPVSPGLGARAGVAISRVYFGVGVMYYVEGDRQTAPPSGSGIGGVTGANAATISVHDLAVGGELGYDFRILEILMLRPQVGLGAWTVGSSCQSSGLSCSGASSTNVYVEPGVTGLVLLGSSFLLGADANGLLVPASGRVGAALSMHAQAGVRF